MVLVISYHISVFMCEAAYILVAQYHILQAFHDRMQSKHACLFSACNCKSMKYCVKMMGIVEYSDVKKY